MRCVARLTVLALVCGVGAPMVGCAARGSSFETLGVPTPEPRAGRSPVILGWAREQREGWTIKRVQVDDTTRPEWNEATQAPAIMYLEPGEHTIKLGAAQLSDPRDPNSHTRRRYKIRPFGVDLLEGEAQMCVIRLSDDERARPAVSCEAYGYGENEEESAAGGEADQDEYGDEYSDEDEVGQVPRSAEAQAPTPAATAQPEPAATAQPQPAPTAPATPATAEVPSPFGAAPTPGPAATQPPAVGGPPAATPPPPPRRLTIEERLDRLERQMQDVVRLLRDQQR
jgi:hypothetical protein